MRQNGNLVVEQDLGSELVVIERLGVEIEEVFQEVEQELGCNAGVDVGPSSEDPDKHLLSVQVEPYLFF